MTAAAATSHPSRYALAIDIRECVGCQTCAAACRQEFRLLHGSRRNWVEYLNEGTFPYQTRSPMPRLCYQCDRPVCADACPREAFDHRPDGIVALDKRRCDGCGNCVAACPYHAITLNPTAGKADKCDFCLHRVARGREPVCVSRCFKQARVFGDLNHAQGNLVHLLRVRRHISPRSLDGSPTHLFYLL